MQKLLQAGSNNPDKQYFLVPKKVHPFKLLLLSLAPSATLMYSGNSKPPAMGILVDDPRLREQRFVFSDRHDAGRKLGALIQSRPFSGDPLVMAIPAGVSLSGWRSHGRFMPRSAL